MAKAGKENTVSFFQPICLVISVAAAFPAPQLSAFLWKAHHRHKALSLSQSKQSQANCSFSLPSTNINLNVHYCLLKSVLHFSFPWCYTLEIGTSNLHLALIWLHCFLTHAILIQCPYFWNFLTFPCNSLTYHSWFFS